jgi:TFIIS helical bundle-like domain
MSKVNGDRIISEIHDLRKALDKSIKGSDSAAAVLDILLAIEVLPMTPDLIKDSKMGKVLVSTRAKFSAEESSPAAAQVTNKARDILVEWKKIIEDHLKKVTAEKAVIAEHPIPALKSNENVLKIKKVQVTAEPQGSAKIRGEVASFADARRKVSPTLCTIVDESLLLGFNHFV